MGFSRSKTEPGVSQWGLVQVKVSWEPWSGLALLFGHHLKRISRSFGRVGPALSLPGTVLCQSTEIFWVPPGQQDCAHSRQWRPAALPSSALLQSQHILAG